MSEQELQYSLAAWSALYAVSGFGNMAYSCSASRTAESLSEHDGSPQPKDAPAPVIVNTAKVSMIKAFFMNDPSSPYNAHGDG